MKLLPFISLSIALVFLALSYFRRKKFSAKPYYHWFIYLNLTAIGLHQFEEYGWPGHFRDAFIAVFNNESITPIVPSLTSLELLNAFGFTAIFGLIGWFGTRIKWLGLTILFINFSNAFFHLVYSVTQMIYVPGVVTGMLLYFPLCLLATGYSLQHKDVSMQKVLLAFFAGTFISFFPFIHVWVFHALQS